MRVLITGGTGTVGSATVRKLVSQSVPVSVLTHSPEKSKSVPPGVQAVFGDFRKPETLPAAMDGVDELFLITALSQTESEEGVNLVRAAKQAGIKRVVLLSIHDVESAPHIPHFRSKIEIEAALHDSGIPCTVLMPNNFFQNDYFLQQPISEFGVYPQPYGDIGLSRVDVRDIADAAVNALLQEGHEGERYPLVGPEALNGFQTAQIWGRHLGREIRYAGNDLKAWAEQVQGLMPPWLIEDLKTMYAFFQQSGLRATEADLKQQAKILHHPPRDYGTFVAETARAWKG